MGHGPSGQCPRAEWETPGPARGSVGNGLSGNLAQWEAGSVADVNMPTAPGWQTPLREFIKILVPTLSARSLQPAVPSATFKLYNLQNLIQQGKILRIAGG